MMLESPALTAPRQDWERWRDELLRMNRRDPSVEWALQRAQRVLARMSEREFGELGAPLQRACKS